MYYGVYSVTKKREIMKFEGKQMTIKKILSEVNKTEKEKCHMISFH